MRLTNEEDLLLTLAKPEDSVFKEQLSSIIRQGIDWKKFYDILFKGSLLTPLYTRISRLKSLNIINDEFLSRIQSYAYKNIAINASLEKDLMAILKHLADSDIRVIPLKGPVLDRLLYGNNESRPASCDLDLLIRYEDFDKVVSSLRGLGYYYKNSGEIEEYRRSYSSHIGLSSKNSFLRTKYIELHYRLFGLDEISTRFDTEYFFKDAQFISFGNTKILYPNYENLLIYLALHIVGTKSFTDLRYFYDIHQLISRFYKKIDWHKLSHTLKKFNLNGLFFVAINISKEFFGTELPQFFIKSSLPGFIKRRVSKLLIRKKDIIHPRRHTQLFLYRYIFIREYLLSCSVLDFIKRLSKIIFISPEEYKLRRNLASSIRIPFLTFLRLFNPLLALLGVKKRF